jgi:predicted GIY-YIG superfamily endonuclease
MASGVYLLHFDQPFKHARHYLGWAADIDARVGQHAEGTGARLMAVLFEHGIGFELARTWPGASRKRERQLKNSRCTPKYCPLCPEGPAKTRRP